MQLISNCQQTRFTRVDLKFWPWLRQWIQKARSGWPCREKLPLEPWWAPPKPYFFVRRDEVLDPRQFSR